MTIRLLYSPIYKEPTPMKPFDPTKPVKTRDGRPARIVATDARSDYPVVALVEDNHGHEVIRSFTARGQVVDYGTASHDLVNIPELTRRFINVCGGSNPTDVLTVAAYRTRELADRYAGGRQGVLEVVFDETGVVETSYHKTAA